MGNAQDAVNAAIRAAHRANTITVDAGPFLRRPPNQSDPEPVDPPAGGRGRRGENTVDYKVRKRTDFNERLRAEIDRARMVDHGGGR